MQSGFNIPNEAGATFRADVNTALQALAGSSSGNTAPATTYPYQYWADTSTNPATLRQRNSANTAWNVIGTLDTANLGLVTQQNLQNAAHTYSAGGGTANAYTATLSPAPTSLVAGQYASFKATNANTGASTLNLNSLGVKNIVRRDGTALQPGDIPAGSIVEVVYDGTNYQLLNPTAQYLLRKNPIINGNFDIWQRGTSFTANGYTADRWLLTLGTSAAAIVSQQPFTLGQTNVPNNPKYYEQVNITTAGSTATTLEQRIEGVNSFAGQTATISFWAYSSVAKTVTVNLIQNFGSGGTPSGSVTTAAGNVNLTTGWAKYTLTIAVPSISGKTLGTSGGDYLSLQFSLPAAVYNFNVAQVQIEYGSYATDFELRPIAQELALCQRYFEIGQMYTEGAVYSSGGSLGTSQKFAVAKRATPTISMTHLNGFGMSNNPAQANCLDVNGFGAKETMSIASPGQVWWVASWTANAEL